MHFEHIESLWWILATLPMIGAFVAYLAWKKTIIARIGNPNVIKRMMEGHSQKLQSIRVALIIAATALLAIALTQPQWGETNRPIKRTGVDVVFALDLSKSMLARDVNPNRLEAAKNEIRTTLDIMGGDRVGLVVFTAISFQQSPLTTDYGAIRFYLKKLKPAQMPKGGTSVGRAISDSVELLLGSSLDHEADAPKMKRANNQVIVLFTDGEDHESNPVELANIATENGIRVVTVGIGSTQGERIPMYKPDGTLAGFKRDKGGELVRTKLDEDTLERIAEKTGGLYIRYTGENSVANGLVDYVNQLEKSEIETLLKNRYRERFAFFLIPALLLLLLAGVLGERRKHVRSRGLGVLIVLLVMGMGCEDAFRSKLGAVERGIALIADNDPTGAIEAFQKAETEIPANPKLHYDLGIAHLAAGEHDLAQQKLTRALETDHIPLRFDALYNLGLSLTGQEAWKDALETFKDAVKLALQHPGQIDEERLNQARLNMEISFRKLYPACATLEDDLEDNDTPQTASQLEEPSRKDLTLCGFDPDWFRIPAIPGTTVEVTTTFTDLREERDPELPFLVDAADVQIGLYDPSGSTAFAIDQGVESDPEADIRSRKVARSIQRIEVDHTMVGQEGFVLLKIGAAQNREFKYDVNIVSIPPCHALQESSEPNNTPEQAAPLEADTVNLHVCAGDTDFLSVDLLPGDSFFVDAIPGDDLETEQKPALALQIIDASTGNVLSAGIEEAGLLTAGVRDFAGGRVWVSIQGREPETQGPYEVRAYKFAPCPVGDDRFEDNDDASSPAELSPQEPMHRYLRACPGDLDFFSLPLPKDEKKLEVGLALISTPKSEDPTDHPEFSLDLLSASGDQILANSEVVDAPDAHPTPLQRALIVEEVEGDTALLRVGSDQDDFYHLVQLNPQEPPSQDQQDQDDKQEQEEDSEEQDGDQEKPDESQENDDPQDGEDKDDKGDEEEKKEEQAEDSEGESEESEDEKERQEAGEDEQENEGQEEDANRPQPGDQDPDEQRIVDILNALEETDDNFQMKKALQNAPSRLIEKDW